MEATSMGRAVLLHAIAFYLITSAARAETTDPHELRVINAIFSRWGLSEKSVSQGWNTTGDPCSGNAIDPDFDYTNVDNYNPGLACDCNFRNSTCHITKLRVLNKDVTGTIPDELWTLVYLTDLNLARNYLFGPLSPAISNLTKLQYLTFGINALSGEVPRELGLLTALKSLGLGTNNFSGSLPSELGNCTNLEQLYIDSSGVSGAIPSTFAKLRNLQTVWAHDVQFTGRIPTFIGNWSQLQALRFQGNSFEGPIPPTFSNLTALKDLRISEVSNWSSTLEFLGNLKSLSVLILRNNNISGTIPSSIMEHENLTLIDLSFNNLTGQIPSALFNLKNITYLILGNNSLTGSLPSNKSSTLMSIDLSYNKLSGPLPTWVTPTWVTPETGLQINLVANNFESGFSKSSGLNCLHSDFPCKRGSKKYYNFAVNCGGPEIKLPGKPVYERDDNNFGPIYVSSTKRWAVSNVGVRDNPEYTHNHTSINSSGPELFETARLSAGSLRYYGLGLMNGNYTVNLQFAELVYEEGNISRGLGRRFFDIYIQGSLVWKDFNIKKEAGGSSYQPVLKQFNATVLENYLEIHLLWAGKGTSSVPRRGAYGPSISSISVTPNFNPPPSKKRTGLIVGIVLPVAVVSFGSLFALFLFVQRRRKRRTFEKDEEFLGMDARPFTFSYAELRSATGDFNPSNKIGEGGFGHVYKGTLDDGRAIAVKQLSVPSHQGKSQFMAEIATISSVQHRNLVKLYGCCIDGEKRLLVYEYLENKSLDQALFGNRSLLLDWSTRFNICLGIARGLTYLHEESRVRIVHRDVKASNVLLDSDLNPKISDFGLAKLYDDKKTHMSTRLAGTVGYLAPEYVMRGHLSEKVDVYGFGVVALEIVSGRLNTDPSLDEDKIYLLEWAWNLHESNQEVKLVDASLSKFDLNEVKRVIDIALLCTQTSSALRPSMSRVVAMLVGDVEVSAASTKPEYLTAWQFKDVTSFMSEGTSGSGADLYTSTTSTNSTSDFSASSMNASKPMLHKDISREG